MKRITGTKVGSKPATGTYLHSSAKKKTSELLEEEAKKMEEKLKELQEIVFQDVRPGPSRLGLTKLQEKKGTTGKVNAKNKPGSSSGSRKILKTTKGENLIGIKTQKAAKGMLGDYKLPPKVVPIKKCEEVEEFLRSVNLPKYYETFVSNGFEDLDTILELQDEHFKLMGIPLGHKLKILKKVRELTPEDPQPLPEAQIETQAVPISHNDYEELPEPQALPLYEERRTKIEYEALPEPEEEKEITTIKPEPEPLIFNEKLIFEEPRVLSFSEDTARPITPDIPKFCCYHCYKLVPQTEAYYDPISEQHYCRKLCCEKYLVQVLVSCSSQNCSQKFVKMNGIFHKGKYYCSKSCLPVELPDSSLPSISKKPNIPIVKTRKQKKTDVEIEKELDDLLSLD